MAVESLVCVLLLLAPLVVSSPTSTKCEGETCLTDTTTTQVTPVREESGHKSPEEGVLDALQGFIGSDDVTVMLPAGASAVLSPRNLDQGEVAVKLRMDESQARRKKKSKLKKILIPIAIFLVLKALTLIPLFLGLLGIKAWNALQLSFGSFVVSFGLAIYQLTKKLMGDSHPPPPQPLVAAWDKRGLGSDPGWEGPQHLAYRAYIPRE